MEALGFIFSFVAGFLPIGLLLFVIVSVVGTRNEDDPTGERPAALYYNGVLFVTVFLVLFATFGIVGSLLQLTLDKGSEEFFSTAGGHDGDWDLAVRALLAGVVAAGLYQVHDARRRPRAWGPIGQRVRRTYLYTVSFVAVLVAAVAAILALWNLWAALAPGVTGSGPRSESIVGFFTAGFLAAGASALAWAHLREAEPDAPPRAVSSAAFVPPEPPPPPPPVTKPVKAAKAVKKAAKKAR